MPKYWGNRFSHTRDSPKWVKSKRRKKRRKKQLVITMAKLRMAHASTHSARKPPGPKCKKFKTYILSLFQKEKDRDQQIIKNNGLMFLKNLWPKTRY